MSSTLTIWTNTELTPAATKLLREGTAHHQLVVSPHSSASVLSAGKTDPSLARADIAFGQPDAHQAIALPNIRWIEVTSAGYTRYDNEDFREAIRRRNGTFTNASGVFADPCAQHVLAMMLTLDRQLLNAYRDQMWDQSWHYEERRYHCRLLTGQTVLMLGFGAIGRRLAALLAPFDMKIYAVRRRTYSEPGVHIIPEEKLTSALPLADHVINILPDNDATRGYVNERRLGWLKPGARFYNVGRGTTVDQNALIEALTSGRLGAAYLDVTDPEPLPPTHPLWTAPNCYITPHSAGGRRDQDEALVRHFLDNLVAFQRGEPMTDRVL